MARSTAHLVAALALMMVAGACSDNEPTSNSSTSPSEAAPSTAETSEPPEQGEDPARGRALDPIDEPAVSTPTFVLDVGDAVVLLTRNGGPQGHLPGWSLDVEASYARSAPILRSPNRMAIVDGGAVHELVDAPYTLDGPNELEWVVRGDTVEATRFGQEVAAFDHARQPPPVLSALRDRITHQDFDVAVLYDPIQDVRVELPATCRVTDVHPDVSELLVCDDDGSGRSVVTTVAIGVEEAAWSSESDRAAWATVGTTGAEAMVTGAPACGGWGAWDVALEVPASTRVTRGDHSAPAAMPLFWTTGGGRWVAFLGEGCEDVDPEPGVYEHAPDGTWTLLGATYSGLVAAVVAVH